MPHIDMASVASMLKGLLLESFSEQQDSQAKLIDSLMDRMKAGRNELMTQMEAKIAKLRGEVLARLDNARCDA